MSERTRNLPRRSCLSIPGSSEKMLGKGPGIPADMVFLDLEDSVAPLEKEAARGKVVGAIRDQDWGEKVLCVRINAWDTEWTVYDVLEVVGNAGNRLEEVILGSKSYLEDNTFSTGHQMVNVYKQAERHYEVRSDESAVDVQISLAVRENE